MSEVGRIFDEARRESYIQTQIDGANCKSAWVRDDARQIADYVRSLIATPSIDSDRIEAARGSISAARLALTEALLAVRLAETEFNKHTKRVLKVA